MPLVAAKCTQCGANIEVDDSKEAGICKYCGTAFITEKAITNYNTYVTNNFLGANINVLGGNIENLLKLAENAESAGNPKEANEYYSKVLELDPSNRKALIGKGCSACSSSNVTDVNSNELLSYASKALEGCDDNKFVLDVIKKLHELSLMVYQGVLSFYNEHWKYKDAINVLINGLDTSMAIALFIKKEIENRKLANDNELGFYYIESVKICIMSCVELCKERKYVDSITSGPYISTENKANIKVNADKHEIYLNIYDEMCNLINKLDSSYEIPCINRQTNVSGCYIATCVYGSYDCPQVWTLRRFRDYTLDETWYGRLFIKCYYAISPTLVKWFGKTKWFRSFWKSKLDKIVSNLNKQGIEDTFYNDKY